MFGRCTIALLFTATVANSAPAKAQHRDEAARQLHEQATAHYEAGEYALALRKWQRAYEASERPKLLYNIANAHQGLLEYREAAAALRRFLDEAPDIEQRSFYQRRLEWLERAARQQSAGEAVPAPPSEGHSKIGPIVSFGISAL